MIKNTELGLLKNTIVEAILDRKGKEILVLDLKELDQSIADYFVICHGDSNTQVDAIADYVERHTRTELQEHVLHKEGAENSQWILLDYGDVVVHVFQREIRDFYRLEDLWGDAKIERITEE